MTVSQRWSLWLENRMETAMEPTTNEAPRTQPRAWVVRAGKEARYAFHNLKTDAVSISFQEYGDVDIGRFTDT